jgi:hypothetical protein
MNQWRAEMNRQQSGAHQQAYPDFGQDRGIGLRAVAAAIRYQGDASRCKRWRGTLHQKWAFLANTAVIINVPPSPDNASNISGW